RSTTSSRCRTTGRRACWSTGLDGPPRGRTEKMSTRVTRLARAMWGNGLGGLVEFMAMVWATVGALAIAAVVIGWPIGWLADWFDGGQAQPFSVRVAIGVGIGWAAAVAGM